MSFAVDCPSCGRRVRADAKLAGKKVKCPNCAIAVQIPHDLEDVDSSTEQAKPPSAKDKAGDAAKSKQMPKAKPFEPASPPETWFVRKADGSSFGPVTRPQMDQAAANGNLDERCQLWRHGDAAPKPAGEVYPQLLVKPPVQIKHLPQPLLGVGTGNSPSSPASLKPASGLAGSKPSLPLVPTAPVVRIIPTGDSTDDLELADTDPPVDPAPVKPPKPAAPPLLPPTPPPVSTKPVYKPAAAAQATASAVKSKSGYSTLRWIGGVEGYLELLDQTLLPVEVKYVPCRTAEMVWEAIKQLRVRGAPAIGVAAAYGVCVGLQTTDNNSDEKFFNRLDEVVDYLAGSRPTAVNLFWALDRMRKFARQKRSLLTVQKIRELLLAEARDIEAEDRAMCRAIGRHGSALLKDGQGVLTHCNAGGLATADYGTALAVFFAAHEAGKRLHVYADETRPLLQGARLTAWELAQRGLDVTLICDSMAAQVMREGRVQAVVVGADRIAANGDAANKIGTYGVALLAAAHDIPFYVAAPSSTFDLTLPSGAGIPIEQRDPREITHGFGKQTAPSGIRVYNPAFDVTPAHLIRGIICERGVIEPVSKETIAKMLAR